MNDPWVLNWSQAAAAGPALVGGKGWNLGRLHRYGFRVPIGGVLTAGAYKAVLADKSLQTLQADLAALTPEEVTEPEALGSLTAFQEAIKNVTLPQDIAGDVQAFLDRHGLARTPIAVRSSATTEDSAEASFAGIHQSRLHQTGIQAVMDGILACYASLWTPQAVAYRRRLGLRDQEVLCAVVLCRMVGAGNDPHQEPVSAGVAFSCDPLTGRVDISSLGAVPGSGEKVVDGSANPEEILVQAGPKSRVVERRGDRTTVLTDEQALRLSELVQRVEWALGDGQDPQDVEWAFDGSDFWLVQARPVTRLPRYTVPGAENLPLVWSNANLKDALPGILSTMGWSMTQPVVRHNLFASHRAAGYAVPPGLEVVRRFDGRAYFDLTTLFWAFHDSVGMTPAEFNRSMGGHQPEFQVPDADPLRGPHGKRRNQSRLRLLRAVWRLDKHIPGEIQARFAEIDAYRSIDYTQETAAGLRKHLMHFVDRSHAFGPLSILATTSAGLWHQILEQVMARVAPDRAAALTSMLLAGTSNVSAEHGYRLFDLAAAAQSDDAARAFLHTDPLRGAQWRELPQSSPLRLELERFLREFGHRAVYEVDVANPRWIEDPTYLLEQVRQILATGDVTDPRRAGLERRKLAEAEIAKRTRVWRPVIGWLARRARHGFAMRESSKSALVAQLEPCQAILREVGRRMVQSETLDVAEDIFELAWPEVDAYLQGWWDGTGARNLAQDRRTQRMRWLKTSPPDVIFAGDGEQEVVQPPTEAVAGASLPGGHVLRGSGVAAGTASGPARILRHPNESAKLKQGDVLVAPSTDPGWTPLFMRASAIVMEVGGYHSHGAIVAREYGIPAVVNIPQLLQTIEDGEMLTVQGDVGAVVREHASS